MSSKEDIESYLVRLGLPFEEVADCLWVVQDTSSGEDGLQLVVHHRPPTTLFRVKLMDAPECESPLATSLYRKLLELNAGEMLSGAYGIEEDSVVCVEVLQSENLDFNEFQAAVDSLFVAMTEHYPVLREFRTGAAAAEGARP